MDIKAAEEFLDQLFSSLESMETQSAAILQFMKQQNGATDEQLAPYFKQAGNASNVRWRAASRRRRREAHRRSERILRPKARPVRQRALQRTQPGICVSRAKRNKSAQP